MEKEKEEVEELDCSDEALDLAFAEWEEEEEEREEKEEEIEEEEEEGEEKPFEELEELDLGKNEDFDKKGEKKETPDPDPDPDLMKLLEDKVKMLEEKLKAITVKPAEREETVVIPKINPDKPLTYGDLDAAIIERENEKAKVEHNYRLKYLEAIVQMKDGYTVEEHNEIFDRMQKDFDRKETGNPDIDAKQNFANAERVILREKLGKVKEKKVPVKGGDAENATLDTSGRKAVKKEKKAIKLDPIAAEYVSKFGYTDEEVQRILG